MKEDLESSHSKQVIVTRYEKLQLGNNQMGKKLDQTDLSSSSTLLNTSHFNNNNANANVSFRKENNQSKNLAIKNLFKENTNSQRSGSANSLISNLKNDSTSSNGLMTTLIKLNHHR